jgi:hypothetical protein
MKPRASSRLGADGEAVPVVGDGDAIADEAHVLGAPVTVRDHALADLRDVAGRAGDVIDERGARRGDREVEQLAVGLRPELGRLGEEHRGERRVGRERPQRVDDVRESAREAAADRWLVRIAPATERHVRLDHRVPAPERERTREHRR